MLLQLLLRQDDQDDQDGSRNARADRIRLDGAHCAQSEQGEEQSAHAEDQIARETDELLQTCKVVPSQLVYRPH